MRMTVLLAALTLSVSALSVLPASADELIRCANEGGYCSVPYPTRVFYGARGRVTSREVRSGIACNNYAFGDPAPNYPKACSFEARGGRFIERREFRRNDDEDRRGFEPRRRFY